MKNGITLVALVVTIVVLLILAGISLNLVLGQNGIVQRAQDARSDTSQASVEEKVQTMLGEYLIDSGVAGSGDLEAFLNSKKTAELSSVTKNDDGTFTVEKDGYEVIVNADGTVGEATKITPVEVEGVTIPKGYYYVGGTKAKGIVISDAVADKEKYINVTDGNIPQTDLVGNQWVWVPVETPNSLYVTVDAGQSLAGSTGVKTTKYTKSAIIRGQTRVLPGDTSSFREPDLVTNYDNDSNAKTAGFSSLANMAETITSEYEEMIESLETYKGFYIGRYELSVNGEKAEATQTSKTWYELYKNCTTLAVNSKVKTRMIWGLQWDATCSWLASSGYNITNSTDWGNYSDNTADGHGSKQNTGFSESWKANNIYDFAGNCYEWTQEAYSYGSRALRGGNFRNSGSGNPASGCGNVSPTDTYSYGGSRPTLYLIP